jgi:hypothetical protein
MDLLGHIDSYAMFFGTGMPAFASRGGMGMSFIRAVLHGSGGMAAHPATFAMAELLVLAATCGTTFIDRSSLTKSSAS